MTFSFKLQGLNLIQPYSSVRLEVPKTPPSLAGPKIKMMNLFAARHANRPGCRQAIYFFVPTDFAQMVQVSFKCLFICLFEE